jgi:hypothetical protein
MATRITTPFTAHSTAAARYTALAAARALGNL